MPAANLGELVQYTLDLVNKDRKDFGLAPVTLGSNAAAQRHADDMFANYYISHWGTDGLKPYMRYTLEGGYNYEGENSSYSGWYDRSEDPNRYVTIDAKKEIADLEYAMMYDDASSNWGHRDNILNKWHKKVNIGIAYDQHRLALIQQFEGDYIMFTTLPSLAGGILSVAGKVAGGTVNSVALYYDPLPQPLTQQQLLTGPHSYGLGVDAGYIIPHGYSMTGMDYVNATRFDAGPDGSFAVEADVTSLLKKGNGVYTVVVWGKLANESVNLTNYSIFVQ